MWLLRPLPILVALAIVLPWFVAIGIKSEGAFFAEALGRDFGAKLGSAQETHGGPPGYYLLTTLVMFWPGVIALPLAAVWAWRERRLAEVTLLLAWLVPMWVVLEFVPTKLPHYTLPLYPALALLCGGSVAAMTRRDWKVWAGTALFAAIGLGIAYFGIVVAIGPGATSGLAMPAFVLSCGTVLAAVIVWAWKSRWEAPVLAGSVVAALFFGVMAGPSGMLGLTSTIVAAIEGNTADSRVISPNYREPSLVYGVGTDTRFELSDVEVGDLLVLGTKAVAPACASVGEAEILEGNYYTKGRGRFFLSLHPTDACDPAELETWRAREVARRSGNSG